MKRSVAVSVAAWVLAASAGAQDFDGRRGYIFDQPFVQRISTPAASRLSGVSNIDGAFLPLLERRGAARDAGMGQGARRVGDTLILEAPGKPLLRLTDVVDRRKDDAGDSQRFTYLQDLDRFHVLSVSFDHDRPCFLLVAKGSLKVYFIDYDH